MSLDKPPSGAQLRSLRHCRKCGYSLAGHGGEGLCPECGESFGVPSPPRSFDHICLGCGYDLKGLPDDAKCPECGLDIAHSRLGDSLRNSPRSHITAMRRGATLALAGGILWLLGPIGGIGFIVGGLLPAAQSQPWLFTVQNCLLATIPVGLVLAISGLWRLSVPDPSPVIRDRGTRSRRILRISLILSTLLGLLQILLALGLSFSTMIQASYVAQTTAAIVLLASIVAVLVSGASYIAWLARRIPDQRLIGLAQSVRTGSAVIGPICAVMLISCPCVGALTIPAVFALLVLYAELLFTLRKRLGEVLMATNPQP